MPIKLTFNLGGINYEGNVEVVAPGPVPPVFTCSIDGLMFDTQAKLDAHTASAHPITPPTPDPLPTSAKLNVRRDKGGWSTGPSGVVQINGKRKRYFEVDTKETTGESRKVFRINLKGFNNPDLKFYQMSVDKITKKIIEQEHEISFSSMAPQRLIQEPPELDNTKYLFAVENTSDTGDQMEIWWM